MGIIKRSGLAAVFTFLMVALLVSGARADEKKAASPLDAPASSAGASHNAEGIDHYKQGHWGVAADHFGAAAKADPKLAQAHYNLALAMDKQGNHKEATQHFDEALKLAPQEKAIADSPILKGHLEKMKKH
jgi:Flp pilus assembly protein TadD